MKPLSICYRWFQKPIWIDQSTPSGEEDLLRGMPEMQRSLKYYEAIGPNICFGFNWAIYFLMRWTHWIWMDTIWFVGIFVVLTLAIRNRFYIHQQTQRTLQMRQLILIVDIVVVVMGIGFLIQAVTTTNFK